MNKLIQNLNKLIKEKEYLFFLNRLYFLFSLSTLPNTMETYENKINKNKFFNDLKEIFNDNLEELLNIKDETINREIRAIFLLLENYQNIEDDLFSSIRSKTLDQSILFYNEKLKYLINNKILLTEMQIKIFNSILENENTLYTMPTSFGKSLLIKLAALYRASNKMKTYICVPTVALINEYRLDFNKINKNKEIIISSLPDNKEANIYVVTQERMLNIIPKENDLLIIDEAYEINDKNLRSAILKSLANKFMKKNFVKFFQPNIISTKNNELLNNNNINFKSWSNSFCSQKIIDKKGEIAENIKTLVLESIERKEKIALYSYKNQHLKQANEISNYLEEIENIEREKWYILLKSIYTNYYLPLSYLKKGIVINNGDIPKTFRFIVEKKFKEENSKFKIIICNNTLSKGVNLGIKNIIINAKNGINSKLDIDKFELKNLMGRVGRNSIKILDRIGFVYICLSDKEIINKIKEIKDIDEVKHIDKSSDEDKEKYDKQTKEIKVGEFEPWKFLLDNKYTDEKFLELLRNEKEIIENFYNKEKKNKDDIQKFYNFIISLYGGEEAFINQFWSKKTKKKEITEKRKRYYIDIKTKKYLFNFLFTDIPVRQILTEQLIYYKENNYGFENNKIVKEANLNLIKNIKREDHDFKKLVTLIINDIFDDANKFYEGNFQLIELKIMDFFKQEYNIELFNSNNEINLILDKYSLPNDFRQVLKLKKITTIQEFESSQLFDYLKELID